MELIENYQPEYVKRFKENNEKCLCQTCQKEGNGFPFVTLRWKNQQRESLSLSCQTAAKEILLNPQAFVLHMTSIEQDNNESEKMIDEVEVLNQIFINHVIDENLSYRESLFSLSIVLNKLQRFQYSSDFAVNEINKISIQISELISMGQFKKHFMEIPKVPELRVELLINMGDMRLDLPLPPVQKMSLMLKLSELKILSKERISGKLTDLESVIIEKSMLFEGVDYVFKNYIIYRIFHHAFSDLEDKSVTAFKDICEEIFEIKMLASMYYSINHTFTPDDLVMLISSHSLWREQKLQKNPTPVRNVNTLLHGLAVL